jgi:hypothetical protein
MDIRLRPLIALLCLSLATASCTTIQLSAANLVERDIAPRFEVAYGPGERQRYDVYRALDSLGKPLAGKHPRSCRTTG